MHSVDPVASHIAYPKPISRMALAEVDAVKPDDHTAIIGAIARRLMSDKAP